MADRLAQALLDALPQCQAVGSGNDSPKPRPRAKKTSKKNQRRKSQRDKDNRIGVVAKMLSDIAHATGRQLVNDINDAERCTVNSTTSECHLNMTYGRDEQVLMPLRSRHSIAATYGVSGKTVERAQHLVGNAFCMRERKHTNESCQWPTTIVKVNILSWLGMRLRCISTWTAKNCWNYAPT